MSIRFMLFLLSLLAIAVLSIGIAPPAQGSALMNRLEQIEKERESLQFGPSTPTVRIHYTTTQINAILSRTTEALRGYRELRARLRAADIHDQAFQRRAAALQTRLDAVQRLLAEEKRKPTREGAEAIAASMLWLDRAAVAVDHDVSRTRLRLAQAPLTGPDVPFCVCVAPSWARQSPLRPIAFLPAQQIDLALAGGESEAFQLLIVPYWEPLTNVRVEIGKIFQKDSVFQIRPEQISVWLVESVVTSATLGRERFFADPLAAARPFDMPATASQALLIDIHAAPDQAPGLYEGVVRVTADKVEPIELALRVTVGAFSIAEDLPRVSLWLQNDYLQTSIAGQQETQFIRTWREFLAPFGMDLYRPADANDAAPGWRGWLVEGESGTKSPATADPLSLAAPSALAYRRAGWASWRQQAQAQDPAKGNPAWLVRGWIALDPPPGQQRNGRVAPLVRQWWLTPEPPDPAGLAYLTRASEPQPTLRLLALRDGIEDYAYFKSLARRIAEAEKSGSAGWLARRRWRTLLSVDAATADLARTATDSSADLLAHRAALARALEDAQSRARTLREK